MLSKKKSQMLYQEAILIVFSLIIVSLTLYFANSNVSGTKSVIEKSAPEITYKFPASFVHGFLYTPITLEDKIKLNLDKNKVFYVKDIIYASNNDSNSIILRLKNEYIESMSKRSTDTGGNMHTYYKDFSTQNYKDSDLLYIDFSLTSLPQLEDTISNKNYFYYLENSDKKYTIIYFLKTSDVVDSTNNQAQEINPLQYG